MTLAMNASQLFSSFINSLKLFSLWNGYDLIWNKFYFKEGFYADDSGNVKAMPNYLIICGFVLHYYYSKGSWKKSITCKETKLIQSSFHFNK